MRESQAEILALQELLDRSYARAGDHLKSIFRPEKRLSAQEVVSELGGILEIHLATTTPSGAPFVAPIDALFFKGEIWFGIPGEAVRAPFFRRDPRVSASYTRGESFALIVHGTCVEVAEEVPEFDAYCVEEYVKLYGPGWLEWRDKRKESGQQGGGYRIDARRMFVKR